MFKFKLLVGFLCFLNWCLYAQIPKNPNLKDSKGLKQGKWTQFYDKLYQEVSSSKDAYYYRISEYKDDQPVGITRYYFIEKNQLHFEGNIIKETANKTQYQGLCTWFYENGNKMREINFDNQGEPTSFKLFDRKGNELSQEVAQALEQFFQANQLYNDKEYQKAMDIYNKIEPLLSQDVLGDDYHYLILNIAECALKLKLYGKAARYFDKSLPLAKNQFGELHPEYEYVLQKAADAYLLSNNISQFEFVINELKTFYVKTKGTNSKEYVAIINSEAFGYYYHQKYDKALNALKNLLPIQEQITGKKHKDYVTIVKSITDCYEQMNDCKSALPYLREAKALYEELNLTHLNDYQSVIKRLQKCQ